MILSNEKLAKLKQSELMIIDGWSMTYALNRCGININIKQNKNFRKTNEYIKLKNLYLKIKYKREGDRYGFMEQA